MLMKPDPYADVIAHLLPGARLTAVNRLTGGVSADVFRLDAATADGGAASLVLRAHGRSHAGHAAELEFQLQRALHRGGIPVPEPLLVDVSGELLPDPYLIMTFIDATSEVPGGRTAAYLARMAALLASIHDMPLDGLPALPARNDPLPEVFDFLPEGARWDALRSHLRGCEDSAYTGPPRLLHGDFWPENVLWRQDAVVAVLDWEDAAFGDPLSDVACARLELRYRFGRDGMQRFTDAYAAHRPLDGPRLALWQIYVAAAAQKYMGKWGLDPDREAHMRREALASIAEAGAELMGPSVPG